MKLIYPVYLEVRGSGKQIAFNSMQLKDILKKSIKYEVCFSPYAFEYWVSDKGRGLEPVWDSAFGFYKILRFKNWDSAVIAFRKSEFQEGLLLKDYNKVVLFYPLEEIQFWEDWMRREPNNLNPKDLIHYPLLTTVVYHPDRRIRFKPELFKLRKEEGRVEISSLG